MSVDHIRYDLLTQQALRAVVRRVLSDVAKTGSLPGEHHFYVTFDTRAPGVKLSRAHARAVSGRDDHRAAAPVLGSRGERCAFRGRAVVQRRVGKAARAARRDQGILRSVGAVRAAVRNTERDREAEGRPKSPRSRPSKPKTAKPRRKAEPEPPAAVGPAEPAKPETAKPAPAKAGPALVAGTDTDDPDKPSGGAEVVRLDRFRKK